MAGSAATSSTSLSSALRGTITATRLGPSVNVVIMHAKKTEPSKIPIKGLSDRAQVITLAVKVAAAGSAVGSAALKVASTG